MLLAASGFLGLRYWQQRQAASHAVEHSRQVLDTLDRLRANIADLETERRGVFADPRPGISQALRHL
jgi:anti-sigma-K factor RskA